MEKKLTLEEARACLLTAVHPVRTEYLALSQCVGRILAQDVFAQENVPPFDRSPYDGYALRAEDTENASKQTPVTLQVLETVPSGKVPALPVTKGTATKVMTGSPIPQGADAVVMFEKTVEEEQTVSIFAPVTSGSNIVHIGEDVRRGMRLAHRGVDMDAGLAASFAAQGIVRPSVYRQILVGIISTGNELVEADQTPEAGKIRNTNRYMLEAAIRRAGFCAVYLGKTKDTVEEISALLETGLAECDAVILTGGVSVGEYDLTPDAMQAAGTELLFRGVKLKPGMACAYGICRGKPVCALSGNPASAMTNFYALTLPALRKLSGRANVLPETFPVKLMRDFPKASRAERLLRGRLVWNAGESWMDFAQEQGNVVISSAIGCNMMAVIPAESGPVCKGTVLQGFFL